MANPLRLIRLAVALLAVLGGHVAAYAASATLYNPVPAPVYDTTGALARGAKVYFYSAGTSTPLTVYQDAALTTPWTSPVSAGANGVIPPVYLPYVDYRVRITTFTGSVIVDADNIANPAPAASGGGGATPAAQLFNTGYIIATMGTGALDGFVRMNGRTIGSASSGGTERANADTEDLFLYLCSNLDDSIATMGGGRGATCAADWAANKAIVVPSMQGRTAAGVDDMGGSAANVLQVSTTCTATNGSPTVTVTSAAGLGRAMYAIIDGVATGQINSISGTTLTLSANYAGSTGTGKTCRLSYLSNAQTAGLPGGSQSATMTSAEMAQHNHAITDPGHFHSYTVADLASALSGGAGLTSAGALANTGSKTTGITINNSGQGLPSSVVQPVRLMTYYIKL